MKTCDMCTHWGYNGIESVATVKMEELWEADKYGNVELCLACMANPDRHYDAKMATEGGNHDHDTT